MKISVNQYAKSLFELTAGKSEREINSAVLNFIKFLQKNRQMKLAGKIIEKFGEIYNKRNGIAEADVITAQKLESHQVHKIESYIKEKYDAKETVIKNIVDENIKGGMIIKVGDEVADGSVRGQLERLRKCLEL